MTHEHGRINRDRLVRFLTHWRERLTRRPPRHRTDEEFGQLLALNTLLCWIEMDGDDEAVSASIVFGEVTEQTTED